MHSSRPAGLQAAGLRGSAAAAATNTATAAKEGRLLALLVEEPGRGNPPPPAKPAIDYNAKSLQMQKGMTEKQVIDLLGQPLKSEVRTCGAKLAPAEAWSCKSWTYGAPLGDMRIIFSESSGDWRVSGWTVH